MLKLVCSILVFLEVGIFAYLPYLYPKLHSNKILTTIISCFSSGLFLGLSLLHVLPESNQLIQSALKHNHHSHHSHEHHDESHHHHHAHQQSGHHHSLPYGSVVAIFTFVGILALQTYFHNQGGHSHGSHSHGDHTHIHDHEEHQHQQTPLKKRQKQNAKPPSSANLTKMLLTQFALSVHSFFECMSLGVQTSEASVLTLLIGILIHKWAEGLTLGYAYKAAHLPPSKAIKFVIFHACLNGSAVLIGWKLASINLLVAGILSSVSAGTFLYVCMIEKIQHEFSNSNNLKIKVLAMVAGVLFVCAVA